MIKICQILLNFVALILLILFYLLVLIFGIYRFIIGLYLKLKYRCQVEFLSGRDAFFAYEKAENRYEVGVVAFCDYNFDLNIVKNHIDENWLQAKNSNGRWKFEKLHQCLVSECGYYFWKMKSDSFIDDHFCVYDGIPPKNDYEVHVTLGKLLSSALPKENPLWKLHVIPLSDNFNGLKQKQIYFCLKFHHCLSDGVSFVRMINLHSFHKKYEEFLPSTSRRSKWKCFLYFLQVIFLGPGFLLRDVLKNDKNFLEKTKLTGIKLVSLSTPISMSRVQKIKSLTKCSINTILMTCLAGAVREYFLQKNKKIKKRLQFALPVSLQRKSQFLTFTNRVCGLLLNLAIQDNTSYKRLLRTEKRVKKLRNSPQLLVTYSIINCLNFIPNYFMKFVLNFAKYTAVYSVIYGPKEPVVCNKTEIFGLGYFVPTGNNVGITVSAYTADKWAQFGVKVDTEIMEDQHVLEKFVASIVEEFDKLEEEVLSLEKRESGSHKNVVIDK